MAMPPVFSFVPSIAQGDVSCTNNVCACRPALPRPAAARAHAKLRVPGIEARGQEVQAERQVGQEMRIRDALECAEPLPQCAWQRFCKNRNKCMLRP